MRDKSWVRLLSYCLAMVLAGSLAIAVLFAGASLAFGFGQDSASPQPDSAGLITVSGVISDSRCGPKHTTKTGNTPTACTRVCTRRGAQYVVVSGDTTYLLIGSQSTFDAFAGQRTQVSGRLAGNTLKVTSVHAP